MLRFRCCNFEVWTWTWSVSSLLSTSLASSPHIRVSLTELIFYFIRVSLTELSSNQSWSNQIDWPLALDTVVTCLVFSTSTTFFSPFFSPSFHLSFHPRLNMSSKYLLCHVTYLEGWSLNVVYPSHNSPSPVDPYTPADLPPATNSHSPAHPHPSADLPPLAEVSHPPVDLSLSAEALHPPAAPLPSYFTFACPKHGMFTSPTSNIPPPCCHGSLAFNPDFPASAKWALICDNRYDHLALTPSLSWFSSPLLSVLNYTPDCALKHSARGFLGLGLEEAYSAGWRTLESNLWTITQWLDLWCLHSLDKKVCILPWKFGYLRLHPTREAILNAIQESHDAFCVWVGYCSYLMLLSHKIGKGKNRNSIHRWEFQLTNKVDPQHPTPGFTPIKDEIITDLKESELNVLSVFSMPCAGIMVNMTFQYLASVIDFIEHKIPVYFCWGQMNSTQNYHPFLFDLQYAPTLAEGRTAMGTAMKWLQYVSQPEHPQLQPVPERLWHGRLQCPGEHPWSYLNRQAHEIADFYHQVDAQEREAIDSRTRCSHYPLQQSTRASTNWRSRHSQQCSLSSYRQTIRIHSPSNQPTRQVCVVHSQEQWHAGV